MALIGYAKKHPSYCLKKQIEALKEAGCSIIYAEQSMNENSELLKALDVYEEGKDVFVTLLHRKNDVIQPQFRAVLELKKYTSPRGRPRKTSPATEEIVFKLREKKMSNKEICEILNISLSTLSRIK